MRHLVSEKASIWALARSASETAPFVDAGGQLSLLTLDLAEASQEELNRLFPEVDVVFHTAAGGVTDPCLDPSSLSAINVAGTEKVIRAARDNGVRRFVHIGSCFEYGDGAQIDEESPLRPRSAYASTKVEASKAVLAASRFFEFGSVVLRPFMVYGPGESETRLVPHIIRNAIAGREINLTGGEQIRDFVFVEDVISALVRTSYVKGIAGQAFNLCRGYGVKVKAVAKMVLELTNSESKLNLAALPYRENEAMSIVGDPQKSLASLGWSSTTSLRGGLIKTIEDIRVCQTTNE